MHHCDYCGQTVDVYEGRVALHVLPPGLYRCNSVYGDVCIGSDAHVESDCCS